MTLEESINHAAEELPEGWIIEINVENGSAWVDLYDGSGNHSHFHAVGTISEQVSEAISHAKLQMA